MEALRDSLLAFAPSIMAPLAAIQPTVLHSSATALKPTSKQQPLNPEQPSEPAEELAMKGKEAEGEASRQQAASGAQPLLQPRDTQHSHPEMQEVLARKARPVSQSESQSQSHLLSQPHSQSQLQSQPQSQPQSAPQSAPQSRPQSAQQSDAGTPEQVHQCQETVEALPRECVALILSKCGPGDVGRAACVCKAWEGAAESEEVWARWEALRDMYRENFPELKEAQDGRRVFEALRRGAFSASNGTAFKEYMLSVEPKTGTLSLHVSAFRCLYFYQRNDTSHDLDRLRITPYGLWPTSAAGSTFANSAALAAGLFHIRGELCPDFSLPPGTYSISFKLAKPPALQREALFPAVCMVSLSGESDALVDIRIDLHKDGVPAKCQCPPGNGPPQALEPPVAQYSSTGEPEFWAKSPSLEREQDSAWETINSMFLSAYSYFDAEAAWRMQLSGERVKPWKRSQQALRWEEFCIGELELKDEGSGCAPLAIDIVLTDLECYTFQGPIWLDSVVITQLVK